MKKKICQTNQRIRVADKILMFLRVLDVLKNSSECCQRVLLLVWEEGGLSFSCLSPGEENVMPTHETR